MRRGRLRNSKLVGMNETPMPLSQGEDRLKLGPVRNDHNSFEHYIHP